MDDELREYLATEFAGVIETTREKKWKIFTEAAKQSDLDPYVALARMLVRIVEQALEGEAFDPENN